LRAVSQNRDPHAGLATRKVSPSREHLLRARAAPDAARFCDCPERRHDIALAVLLAALTTVQLGFLLVSPTPSDPLESVWLTPDSPDWLAAGLQLAGENVTCNDRPPLVPLVYAALYRLGFERAIPKIHELSFFLLVAATSFLAWKTTRDKTATLLALLLASANGTLWFLSRFLMADVPAAALSAAAAACLVGALSSVRYAVAFVAFALAAQSTQNVLPILFPPFLFFLLVARKTFERPLAFRIALAGLLASPLALAAYHLAMRRETGGVYPHVTYLGFSAADLPRFAWAVVTLLGPVALLAPLFGTALLRRGEDAARRMLAVWAVTGFLFFALFYRYFAKRFALFFAPALVVLAAWGLARWIDDRRPAWRAAGACVIAASLWLGTLSSLFPYETDLVLAPGVAVPGSRPPDSYGFVHRRVANPEALRAPFGGGVFADIAELRGLARAHPEAVASGQIALVDARRQVVYVYITSVAFRSPVAFAELAAPLDRFTWILVRKPERPANRKLVAESASWALYRTVHRSIDPAPFAISSAVTILTPASGGSSTARTSAVSICASVTKPSRRAVSRVGGRRFRSAKSGRSA
jgi:hypothetical protein